MIYWGIPKTILLMYWHKIGHTHDLLNTQIFHNNNWKSTIRFQDPPLHTN